MPSPINTYLTGLRLSAGNPDVWADAFVHAIGLVSAVVFALILAGHVAHDPSWKLGVALGIYAIGLGTMWCCSALYNFAPPGPRKSWYRRLDHAAIYLMILGTYTPFCAVTIGGTWGWGLLAVVWVIGSCGAIAKLAGLSLSSRTVAAGYLLLGWAVLAAAQPVAQIVSPLGMALLGLGGVLYTIGVLFHLHPGLRYQRAIWHSFVLAGASAHFGAILTDVVG